MMDELPKEILRVILWGSVDGAHDLALRLSPVSKLFNEIANENEVLLITHNPNAREMRYLRALYSNP